MRLKMRCKHLYEVQSPLNNYRKCLSCGKILQEHRVIRRNGRNKFDKICNRTLLGARVKRNNRNRKIPKKYRNPSRILGIKISNKLKLTSRRYY